ncbi:aldehyde dehydrogenase family protein [Pigmentiphaga sp. H8]|uniref:aldehyde dehydrogenase family protein n=1 Tax=Pigmentiphaga sp. H8 TaxID=2488560 RepID=UPI000F5A3E0F|nr:aldehyde dehydrogenase family protein [Pigmentiphaga sp. H8]AZG07991.1 aldehyde dehydrogenase family protein [Pigmentiphaga sp. H8]
MTAAAHHDYYAGGWLRASGTRLLTALNPYTEQPATLVRESTPEDVDHAVGLARQAFTSWSAMETGMRAEFLQRVASGMRSRAEDLARSISTELGMPIKLCRRIQVELPISTFEQTAALLASYPWSERMGHSLVLREAAGVVAAVSPWNYPLHQIVAKLAPALGAGCTVVLKPSELTPGCALMLAEIFDAAGVPPGVFNLVPGAGAITGEALVSHSGIDVVSFTGSTQVGRHIMTRAAQTIKRVRLELGGKSASVVLRGADLARSVKHAVASCMLNSGQTCSALTRLLVAAEDYDEAIDLARAQLRTLTPGDPLDERTRLGPVISASHRDRIHGYVRRGIDDGAQLLAGGPDSPDLPGHGYFVAPTLLGDVRPDAETAQEEIFGPVLCMLRYRHPDDAADIANHSRYGLAGAVWAGDDREALAFARRLRTGQVDINGAAFNPAAPFGGYKQSGLGRELGRHGLDEFVELKSVQLPQPVN